MDDIFITHPMRGKDYREACLSKMDYPHEITHQLLNWVSDPHDMLYFSGTPGVAKSLFMGAFINRLIEKNKKLKSLPLKDFPKGKKPITFRYFTENSYFGHLKPFWSTPAGFEREIVKLAQADFFFLDDFGSVKNSDWNEGSYLFPLIDERSANRKPTIFTSNLSLSEVEGKYEGRIYSRLNDGRNVKIYLNDYDHRKRVA